MKTYKKLKDFKKDSLNLPEKTMKEIETQLKITENSFSNDNISCVLIVNDITEAYKEFPYLKGQLPEIEKNYDKKYLNQIFVIGTDSNISIFSSL